MRMRRKKWARPELEQCPYYIDDATGMGGKWREGFAEPSQPLCLELGCGKGVFAAQHALKYREANLVAVDIKADILGVARRNIEAMFSVVNETHDNIKLVRMNVSKIEDFFTPDDRVDRIYINFCNPWSREKHKKRRLTHPRQLIQYKKILSPTGEVFFKTDDDGLFEDSVAYFEECGFDITFITHDLYSSDFQGNLITEHEKHFISEGKKIKMLTAFIKDTAPGGE